MLRTDGAGWDITRQKKKMKKKFFISLGIIAISFILAAFTLNCIKCGGEGKIRVKVDCPKCNGDKYDKWGDRCSRCDGNGYIYEWETCPSCGGDGIQKEPVPFPER